MILITGASKGIGKFLIEHYISKGEEVIGFYNNTLPTIHSGNYHKINIENENDIINFVLEKNDSLKEIVLINAAGISIGGFAHKVSLEDWMTTLNINTTGVFLMIKHLLPIMRSQEFGRIINISSVVPQIGALGTVSYAASKSALWGLTKVIANENAEKGITANYLNLGYFNIGMIGTIPQPILNNIIETIPMKKLGNPVNIINAINFLINSDYISGTSIDINGGIY